MRWLLAVVVLIGALAPVAGRPQLAAAEATHAAAPGDTLESIAVEHGVSVNALAAANDLDPWTVFAGGEGVIVPGEGDNPPVSGEVRPEIYVVEAGDTIALIADYLGVSAAALAETNNLEDPDYLDIGQRLFVPAGAAPSGGGGVFIEGIPAYQQARSLSCEYASVYIATSAFGNPIPEEDYIAKTPQAANPHYGYRGNIDGEWGRTDDYGIYAEALVPNLEEHGYVGEVSYGADPDLLRAHLDAGHPVIVWIATRGDTGFYESDETGTYKLVPWEHVVVAYGYDEQGVSISDPGTAVYRQLSWESFLSAWSVLDGMALAVYPAS